MTNISEINSTGWIGVEHSEYELPGEPIDILQWAETHRYPPAVVTKVIDAGARYFHAAPDIGEVDLAMRAVGKLLDNAQFRPSDIGVVMHVHTQQFSVPASPRSLPMEVAAKFAIRPLWAGSVAQLNCVSIAAGLQMMRALMKTYPQLNAGLLVSADRVYGENYRLRQTSGIQSDGAACLLVTRNSRRNKIKHIAIRNYAKWHPGSDAMAEVEREMITFEWQYTREVVNDLVVDGAVPLEQFSSMLPHNSDMRGWQSLCRAMKYPEERLFTKNIFQRGHACCSDLAINLADHGLATLDRKSDVLAVLQSNTGAFTAISFQTVN
jgi:3-oxoacyl-[acyl-carrier-protein] synthase III